MTLVGLSRDWLVIGHYGGRNTGDEAMLFGLLRELDRPARTTVLSKASPSADFLRSMGVRVRPSRLLTIITELPRHRTLVLGGGTHFHDDYSSWRWFRHAIYLGRLVTAAAIARLLRRRVVWAGMGFGPLRRRSARFLTWLGLRFCHHITVRDAASFRETRGWAKDRISVGFDLAALLSPPTVPDTKEQLGISLTGRGVAEQELHTRVSDAVCNLLEERPALQVRVLVLRGGTREADEEISRSLVHELERTAPGRVALVPWRADPNTMLAEIGRCGSVLATRYHAALLAYLAGCRLLLLPYHRKLDDLADEIALPKDARIGMDPAPSSGYIVSKLRDLLDGSPVNRAGLPVSIARDRAAAALRAALYAVDPLR